MLLAKRVQNWIVDRFTARDFTVCVKNIQNLKVKSLEKMLFDLWSNSCAKTETLHFLKQNFLGWFFRPKFRPIPWENLLLSTKQEHYILKVEVDTKTLPRFSSWKFSMYFWIQAKLRKKPSFFLASHAPRNWAIALTHGIPSMPKNLGKVQIYPKPVKWGTLFWACFEERLPVQPK